MPISKSEEETHCIAEKIAKKIKNGGVVCLFGDLGTGKTVFAKGIAHYLGIDKFSIKSPTYTYIRKHKRKDKNDLYHIDLYRLDKIDNILLREIDELLEDKENILIIEWADRMGDHLPKNRINVKFEYIDKNKRKIIF
ncbi:tRNA (adenosine(37)-N6)-threonylcarbamoyltransferase complex ATPase subunit type 1 TsaE [Candidatus Peregrinibacteria bacterium]|nr:tRNA (adenosine(37)-N6)-threonylcarbamoyltransferase complex ATPase subunit type 1 TsaE [Candidatus Peregrinibacteria bacterium]